MITEQELRDSLNRLTLAAYAGVLSGAVTSRQPMFSIPPQSGDADTMLAGVIDELIALRASLREIVGNIASGRPLDQGAGIYYDGHFPLEMLARAHALLGLGPPRTQEVNGRTGIEAAVIRDQRCPQCDHTRALLFETVKINGSDGQKRGVARWLCAGNCGLTRVAADEWDRYWVWARSMGIEPDPIWVALGDTLRAAEVQP